MPQAKLKIRNKHQLRTEETQARILDAAQRVFSEQGFEQTQLDEVANRAGFTRGAIYAHYASKEDLFLALVEQRVLAKFTMIRGLLEAEPVVSKRLGIAKQCIAAQAADKSWGILILEFKLYALRRPQSRERLQNIYKQISTASNQDFIELLFGDTLNKSSRQAAERRLSVISAIVSAVILESYFRPKLFSKPHLEEFFHEIFEALIHA